MKWIKVRRPSTGGLWKKLGIALAVLGPGFITANVDNDAGGIATFSMAGAYPFGYACLWTIVPITLMLILTQEMGFRMGAVTGKGLADLIREKKGLRTTFYLMSALLIANIGNTIAEFSGVAASLEIFGIAKWLSVPLAAIFVWFLVVKGSYKIVEKVFLFATLFYVAYIISGVMAKPSWEEVGLAVLAPRIQWSQQYLYMVIGLIGAAIAPWMQFYVQAAVVEKGLAADDYQLAKWDVVAGCIVANTVAFFIMMACGATLGKSGIAITSAAEAGLALRPLAGHYASLLFSFGLFVASLFAASILPLSTAYTISEGLGFEAGVNKTFREAPHFYGLYTAIIAMGAIAVLWPRFPLLPFMVFSQVVNALLLPFVMLFVIQLASSTELMGEFTNSRRMNILCYSLMGMLLACNGLLIYLWLGE
ncbi:MAG: divalent metal cation transporter [Deltaproteobacteria bacterium]|nr:divalent metal cation transporter [Deltaproteobacteria bacterium]